MMTVVSSIIASPRVMPPRAPAGVADRDGPHGAGVALDGGLGEPGDLGVVDGRQRLPDEVGRLAPAGAEDQRDVVALHAGGLRPGGGRLGRGGGRVGEGVGRHARTVAVIGTA